MVDTVPLKADSLSYEIHGKTGPPVLFLHGLGSRGQDWIFQIEALQDEYRMVTLDLRGHGDSPAAEGWPTILDFAEDVVHLLEDIEIPQAHVVGLSLGGGVALQLGVDFPEYVKSLTIANSAATLRVPMRRLHSAAIRVAFLATGQRQKLGEWVASGLFPQDDQQELRAAASERIASNARLNYFRSILAILRFDLRKRVHLIHAPTLVVAGDLDTTVPLKPKVKLAQSIPDARLEVIEGSGHATPLDAPAEFNRILLEFLREQDRANV